MSEPPPVAAVLPSGEMAVASTMLPCSLNEATRSPEGIANTLLTFGPPLHPVSALVPSGEMERLSTVESCRARVLMNAPVRPSHSRMVRSQLPERRYLPPACAAAVAAGRSGVNAADFTLSVWPVRVSMTRPARASHSFSVWSSLPVTARAPSGENATA